MLREVISRKRIECTVLENLEKAVERIISFSNYCSVWVFDGELGSGKTTVIKAICDYYGVQDNVTSPTFSIINEYLAGNGELIYHFDFYRIKDGREAWNLGLEEYFYSGNRCLIEWPSKVQDFLPEQYVAIEIQVNPDDSRSFDLTKHDRSL